MNSERIIPSLILGMATFFMLFHVLDVDISTGIVPAVYLNLFLALLFEVVVGSIVYVSLPKG